MVKHLEQPNLLAQQYAVAELQSLFEIWLTCASGLLFAVTPAATVNLKSQPQTELNEPGIFAAVSSPKVGEPTKVVKLENWA